MKTVISSTFLIGIILSVPALADERFIIAQSTTSTQNSGLFDVILPMFREKSGIEVRVVAVGTGQAIRNAQNCDGDVLIVHAMPAEEEFVAAGYGTTRTYLMYNDFIIVGPSADPSGVRSAEDIGAALSAIAKGNAPFASRGDDSGTHKAELRLWAGSDIDPKTASGKWYRETGSGMGATLNIATGMDAYALTDRATWIAFGNKVNHEIVFEGDTTLFNQYSVIPVNPAHCPDAKTADAAMFAEWLLSANGQAAIAAYRRDGEQLFFPNAPLN